MPVAALCPLYKADFSRRKGGINFLKNLEKQNKAWQKSNNALKGNFPTSDRPSIRKGEILGETGYPKVHAKSVYFDFKFFNDWEKSLLLLSFFFNLNFGNAQEKRYVRQSTEPLV